MGASDSITIEVGYEYQLSKVGVLEGYDNQGDSPLRGIKGLPMD